LRRAWDAVIDVAARHSTAATPLFTYHRQLKLPLAKMKCGFFFVRINSAAKWM